MLLSVFVPARSFKIKRKPQSSGQPWTGWALAAALLLGYPLSFGPVLILCAYRILPGECLLLYSPLFLIGHVLHPILTLMHWSVYFCIRLMF
jgi:hypothetical protein